MKQKKVLSCLMACIMLLTMAVGSTGVVFANPADTTKKTTTIHVCPCPDVNRDGHTDPNCDIFKMDVAKGVELYNAVDTSKSAVAQGEAGYEEYLASVRAAKAALSFSSVANSQTKKAIIDSVGLNHYQKVNAIAENSQSIKVPESDSTGGNPSPDSQPTNPEGPSVPTPPADVNAPTTNYDSLGGVTLVFNKEHSDVRKVQVEANPVSRVYGDKFVPAGITVTVYGTNGVDVSDWQDYKKILVDSNGKPLPLTVVCDVAQDEKTDAGKYYAQIGFGDNQYVKIAGEQYALESTNGAVTYTVSQRPITVEAQNVQKGVGEADVPFTYNVVKGNIVNNDKLYSGEDEALYCDPHEDVEGSYPILNRFDNKNYKITYKGANLEIVNPLTRTVFVKVGFVDENGKFVSETSREYGSATPETKIVIEGLAEGETVDESLLTVKNYATPVSSVGTYNVDIFGLGDKLNSHNIKYVGAKVNIVPRVLNITADSVSKKYGSRDPELTYAVTAPNAKNPNLPFVNDAGTPTVSLYGGLKRVSGNDVGEYEIQQNFKTAYNKNYTINYTSAMFTIEKADAELRVNDAKRIYGEKNPKLVAYFVVDGRRLSTFSPVATTTADKTSEVGEYEIVATCEAAEKNYNLTVVPGKLTVVPRPVNIYLDDMTSTYGDAMKAPTYTVNSNYSPAILDGDFVDVQANIKINDGKEAKNVGNYNITCPDLQDKNYSFTVHNGKYIVTPRRVDITIDNKESVYGEELLPLTYQIAGANNVLEGDDLNVEIVPAYDKVLYNAGSYKLVARSDNPNYALSSSDGTYIIKKRPINVKIDDKTSVYGETSKELTYTLSCELGDALVNDDVLYGKIDTNPAAINNAGTYPINSGLYNKNYDISVEKGKYTIEKRPVKIEIDNKTSVYGQPLEKITYKISCPLGEPFIEGDSIPGKVTLKTPNPRNVGTYEIISTMANSNYEFSVNKAEYEITKRPLNVVIENQKTVYGDPLAELKYTLSSPYGAAIAEGDKFTGEIVFESGKQEVNAGRYNLLCTFKAPMDNYAINITNGQYTILPAPIDVAIESGEKLYGTETIVPSASFSGFRGSDKEHAATLVPSEGVIVDPKVEGINGYVSPDYKAKEMYESAFAYHGSIYGNYSFSSASADYEVSRMLATNMMYGIEGSRSAKQANAYYGDVVIKAANGYRLSRSDALENNTWSKTLTIDKVGANNETFYVMREEDGAISSAVRLNIEILEEVSSSSSDIKNEDGEGMALWLKMLIASAVIAGFGVFVAVVIKKAIDKKNENSENSEEPEETDEKSEK